MARPYYMLFEFDHGAWSPQFGDYTRGPVEFERRDMASRMPPRGYGKRLQIVRLAGDTGEHVVQATNALNAPLGLCEHGG